MRSGPSTGVVLFGKIRRVVAATAVLSLLTLSLSVPPSTTTISGAAAAAPHEGAAAFSFDDAAEARELDALDRATRKARADAAVKTGLGSVEVAASPAQPKTATATKKTPAKKPAKVAKQVPPKKKAGTTQASGSSGKKPAQPVAASGRLQAVVAFALRQQGKPYRWGSKGPNAYDCSGLLVASFKQIGISLPHQSEQIARRGKAIPRSQWVPGTALHYSGHISLYVGNGKMVHASRAGKPVAVVAVYGSPQGIRIG